MLGRDARGTHQQPKADRHSRNSSRGTVRAMRTIWWWYVSAAHNLPKQASGHVTPLAAVEEVYPNGTLPPPLGRAAGGGLGPRHVGRATRRWHRRVELPRAAMAPPLQLQSLSLSALSGGRLPRTRTHKRFQVQVVCPHLLRCALRPGLPIKRRRSPSSYVHHSAACPFVLAWPPHTLTHKHTHTHTVLLN